MTFPRLAAIALIFLCTAVAWSILGGSIVARSGESDARLAEEVAQLWGGRHEQQAPRVYYEVPRETQENVTEQDALGRPVTRLRRVTVLDRHAVALDAGRVKVGLDVAQRRKGLLWYPTYAVAFEGRYRVHNPDAQPRTLIAEFPFPSAQALYDGFSLRFGERQLSAQEDFSKGASVRLEMAPGAEAPLEVAYRSRGMGVWSYVYHPHGVGLVRDFSLDLETNVAAIDFPPGSLSPTTKTRQKQGWALGWRFESLVTGQRIALEPPNKLNPGPFAARVTFFAPVGLLFFFTVVVLLGALRQEHLHPMNYFFLAAAFFAFHLLLAYLVDHVDVNLAFVCASAASLFLVTSYLRLVAGWRFAVLRAGAAQLVFLVLFSYAFFFEGYTGLTVTLGAILTLFVLMQLTGRLDWAAVFAGRRSVRQTGAPSLDKLSAP